MDEGCRRRNWLLEEGDLGVRSLLKLRLLFAWRKGVKIMLQIEIKETRMNDLYVTC